MLNIRTARVTSIIKRMNRKTVLQFKESVRLKRRAVIITSTVVLFPGFLFYCLYDPLYPVEDYSLIIN